MQRLVLFALTAVLAAGEPLDTILARMDAAAKTSTSFSANLKWHQYTKILKSTDEQFGALKLKKGKGGVLGRLDIEKPNAFTWHFTGGALEKFQPKANVLTVYQAAKLAKSADQYLLLVFGLSGADLKKSYDVQMGGEELIGAVNTSRVELFPKDKEAKKLVAKVELWIPTGQTYAIQLKVTAPNGDYNLWMYSDAKLNPPLPDSAYDFVPPANVRREVIKK